MSEIRRHASVATRRRARLRPSLPSLMRREGPGDATAEVAVQLCRSGLMRVWAAIEDVVLVFGGPRSGKTGWMAGRVIDHPGAAVVTSTRTDLLTLCGPFRSPTAARCWCSTPSASADASTITFDPLTGCTDPVTAMERATDMIAATSRAASRGRGPTGTRKPAACWPRCCMPPRSVAGRCATCSAGSPTRPRRPRGAGMLRRTQVAAFDKAVNQFLNTNHRTRTSISSSVMPALRWINTPSPLAAAASGRGSMSRRCSRRGRRCSYSARGGQAGPLVSALTGHIAREARRLAVQKPSGRLDPPLLLALDEAALISPGAVGELDRGHGRARGHDHCPVPSRAQLLARYGEHKTTTILNNTGSVMLFGGTRDQADLHFWSTLAGERDERVTTTDLHGRVASRTVRKVPVLAPGADREPAGREGRGLPARDRAGDRAGADGVDPRGRARPA